MHAISVRLSCENMVTSLSHVFLCFPGSITDLFFNDKHCIMSVTPVFVIFFLYNLSFSFSSPHYTDQVLCCFCSQTFSFLSLILWSSSTRALSAVLDPQMPELLISSLSQMTVAMTDITDENNLERPFFSETEYP